MDDLTRNEREYLLPDEEPICDWEVTIKFAGYKVVNLTCRESEIDNYVDDTKFDDLDDSDISEVSVDCYEECDPN